MNWSRYIRCAQISGITSVIGVFGYKCSYQPVQAEGWFKSLPEDYDEDACNESAPVFDAKINTLIAQVEKHGGICNVESRVDPQGVRGLYSSKALSD